MSADVASAARQVVAEQDALMALEDVNARIRAWMSKVHPREREFALSVAHEAAKSLDEHARLAILRLAAAALLFEQAHGDKVTVQLLLSLIFGTDAETDVAYEASDRLYREMLELGNLPKAGTWLQ